MICAVLYCLFLYIFDGSLMSNGVGVCIFCLYLYLFVYVFAFVFVFVSIVGVMMSNAVGVSVWAVGPSCPSCSWPELPLSTHHHRRHLGFEAQSAALQVVGGGRRTARAFDTLDCKQGVRAGEIGCVWAL